MDTTTSPATTSSDPTFSLTGQDSAFFLDLATGTQTPLPRTSVEDPRVRFNDGHYYAVSPDGSSVYWENTCCSAADVAAVARSGDDRRDECQATLALVRDQHAQMLGLTITHRGCFHLRV